MKILRRVIPLLVAVALMLPGMPVAATDALRFSQTSDGGTGVAETIQDVNGIAAQTFLIADGTYVLTQADLKLFQYGTGTNGNIIVELRATTDNTVTSTVLDTCTWSSPTFTTNQDGSYYSAMFTGGYVLENGTTYGISIRMATDGGLNIGWKMSGSDVYANGRRNKSLNGGASYSNYTNDDECFKLYGIEAEPAVATVAASSIGTTTATLNGNLTYMGEETSLNVFFGWYKDGGTPYDYYTTPATKTTTGTFTKTLTGLEAGTKYYFAAFAQNSTGTYWYGDNLDFTTYGDPTVVTNDPLTVSSINAILSGTVTENGDEALLVPYFEYGETTAYELGNITGWPVLITADDTDFIAPLTGLDPATTYHYRAYMVGDSRYNGTDKTFITLPLDVTPLIAVTTENATAVGDTTATLNANLTSIGSLPVTVGFQIGYESNFWNTEVTNGTMTSAGTYSYDLTGLRNGTVYWFRAIARDTNNEVVGYSKTFTTTGTPQVYTGITVETDEAYKRSTTSVTLNGNLLDPGNDPFGGTYVWFEYGKTTSYELGNTALQHKYGTGGFSEILTALTPNTTYHYRAGARNVAGESDYGEDVTFYLGTTTTPTATPTVTPTTTPPPTTTTPSPTGGVIPVPTTAKGQWELIIGICIAVPILMMFLFHRVAPMAGVILSIGIDALVLGWAVINWLDTTLIIILALAAAGALILILGLFLRGRSNA